MYANAICAHRKIKHEKMRYAFSIVFYNTKCDREKSKTRNANVSKLSPLRIKVTSRISKGRNEEAKTAKLAKTSNKN